MTAIPHEVLVPQVFSVFQVAFYQFVRMLKVGVVRDLCTGVGITWDSRFKWISRENGRVHNS